MTTLIEDLIAYATVNRPTDNTSTSGGAIDEKMRVMFENMPHAAYIQIVSDSESDTQEITIKGRHENGTFITGTTDMLGTEAIAFQESQYTFLLSAELASDAIGNVTLSTLEDPARVLAVIPPGERGVTALFIGAASDPLTEKVFYEKFFWKNTGDTQIRGVVLSEADDPLELITHAPAPAKDDTGSVSNRLTDPSLTFTNTGRNIPGDYLDPDETIGVWLKKTIPAGASGHQTYYQFGFHGTQDIP